MQGFQHFFLVSEQLELELFEEPARQRQEDPFDFDVPS
jgi:hypothetical protein